MKFVRAFENLISKKIFLVFDNSRTIFNYKINLNKQAKIGLIIQGPVEEKTLETIKIYRSIYKRTMIILSTNSNLEYDKVKFLKKNKIKYFCNIPPETNFGNLLNQQESTLVALNYLKKKGIKFAIKSRSDQRFLNPLFIKHIYNFHKYIDKKFQKILVTSYNSYKNRPFNLSDFFYFGKTNELIKLFTLSKKIKEKFSDSKFIKKSNLILTEAKTLEDWNKVNAGGSLLAYEYIKKKNVNKKIFFNMRHTYKYICEHFIIIDKDILGLVWYKYNNFLNRDYPSMFGEDELFSEISFCDWLEINNNKKIKPISVKKAKLPWK